MWSTKCRKMLVLLLDGNLPEAPSQVHGGEPPFSGEVLYGRVHTGQGVPVRNGVFVNVMIVCDKTQSTAWLLDKGDWCCPCRAGWSYDTIFQHLVRVFA